MTEIDPLRWSMRPAAPHATAEVTLRYDDVDQEDRLKCTAAAHSLGPAVWRTLLREHPISSWCRQAGVMPVLTRLVVDCGEGRLSMRRPLRSCGALDLAHVRNDQAVDRIVLAMWVELEAVSDTVHGDHREGAPFIAGRIFAEHALTALFAPPNERKVRRLGASGYPEVPPQVYVAAPLDEIATVPAGARPIGPPFVGAVTLLGAMHTDANRHVNSLVLPRLFEEAAIAARDGVATGLVRRLEIGYPRPSFAGQRVRARLQAWTQNGGYGASGVVEQLRDDGPRVAAFVRVTF